MNTSRLKTACRSIACAAVVSIVTGVFAETVNLSSVTEDTEFPNGTVLTGTLGANCKISIADGATVTLTNVTVIGTDDQNCKWSGINLLGSANIILKGENVVKGFYDLYPGINVPYGKTLTISGDGSLDASSNGYAAGIGASYYSSIPTDYYECGTIIINSGTITATGGAGSAGIGGASGSHLCGQIIINGGSVTARPGESCDNAIGEGADNSVFVQNLVVVDHERLSDVTDDDKTRKIQWNGDLARLAWNVVAVDGMVIHGELGDKLMVSIADGATVTLSNATICVEGVNDEAYSWAGLTCLGDANIILDGENTIVGFYEDHPGIRVYEGKTLTILGLGSLSVGSNGYGAGIGGGYYLSCGNIVIKGGNIVANGGNYAAGIGGGRGGDCGDITIDMGILRVYATCISDHAIGPGDDGFGGDVTVRGSLKDETDVQKRTICAWDGDLKLNDDAMAMDGTVLHGKLEYVNKVVIAPGATVTLSNATIDASYVSLGGEWAGLTCLGDATIVLEEENYIRGFNENYPGIYVPVGSTLTIRGSGSLDVASNGNSNGYGAGIGCGREIPCGNIVIEGGTIAATGGYQCAGIGGGYSDDAICGSISITGGSVTSVGGSYAAGIGGGYYGGCGSITIGPDIASVTATGGAEYWTVQAIGNGYSNSDSVSVVIDDSLSDDHGENTRNIVNTALWDGNLETLAGNVTISGTKTLFGTLGRNCKISLTDGAMVTLDGVVINSDGHDNDECPWAGITCLGDATIVLEGENVVNGFHEDYPGLYVAENGTLTITGDGSLTAGTTSNGMGAGIGGGNEIDCGSIVVESGTIIATGRWKAAGIGGGYRASCGSISIGAGITSVTATGGSYCDVAIGPGNSGSGGSTTVASGMRDTISYYNGMQIRTILPPWDGNLSTLTCDVTALDGTVIYGESSAYKVSIASGATVTISNAVIRGETYYELNRDWAGLTCEGDATIIVKATNSIASHGSHYPGIYVPEGNTLTLQGDGKLTATGSGAGIGGGEGINCGNIVIEGGTITAIGNHGAGIGGGGYNSNCGNIHIGGGITRVTATRSNNAESTIGLGYSGSTCGRVTMHQDLYNDNGEPTCTIVPSKWDGDLSRLQCDVIVLSDGMTIYGDLGFDCKVSIADGATVTISNATINAEGELVADDCAGLECEGSATIVLEGTNVVRSLYREEPAIYVPSGHTLIIEGNGSLTAYGGNNSSFLCAAGIGGGYERDCGNIEINGGTIKAYGGKGGAGIGGGCDADCGTITIGSGITYVSATRGYGPSGYDNPSAIGAGSGGSCGEVMVDSHLSDEMSYDGMTREIICGPVIEWTFETSGDEATITGASGYGATLEIPGTVYRGTTPYTVTAIADRAFFGKQDITSVTIPESVREIGEEAFYICSSLATLDLGEGVETLGNYAFGQTALANVTIPDSVTVIGSSAFGECSSLATLNLGENLETIGEYAFLNCTNLTALSLGDGMQAIGDHAFRDCTGLATLDLGKSVETIGESAFSGCTNLTSVVVPDSVTEIGQTAFYGCSGLTTLDLGEGVETIGANAFNGCASLTTLTVPGSVSEIGETAFYGCTSLATLVLEEGVETIICDIAFNSCTSLSTVTVPSSVSEIGRLAFSSTSLATVYVSFGDKSRVKDLIEGTDWAIFIDDIVFVDPAEDVIHSKTVGGSTWYYHIIDDEAVLCRDAENAPAVSPAPTGVLEIPAELDGHYVVSIGYAAFAGMSEGLTDVIIPEGVTSIGEQAFYGCSATSVTMPETLERIENNAFKNASLATVYVKVGRTDEISDMLIDSGFDISGVIFVEPSPSGPNGANVRVVKKVDATSYDITEFLDIPAPNASGVIDLTQATVKEAIVKETLDPTKEGVDINLDPSDPSITTAATRPGLTYTFSEGTSLEGMTQKATKLGDGKSWTPPITVKGGTSGFYSVGVTK